MAKQQVPSTGATEPGRKPSPLISNDTLLNLYGRTIFFAMAASHAARQGSHVPGREALLAALTLDLRPDDTVVAAPGDPLLTVLQPIPSPRPRQYGEIPKRKSPFPHPTPQLHTVEDPGARLSVAADTAFTLRHGDGNIVVVFADVAAAASPAARVAFGFAGAARLPLLFVLESRSEAAPRSPNGAKQAEALAPLAAGLGFPAIPVDGADAVALYRVAFESMKRARASGGPTLIDARLEPADALRSHAPHSVFLSEREPLAQLERHLAARGLTQHRKES